MLKFQYSLKRTLYISPHNGPCMPMRVDQSITTFVLSLHTTPQDGYDSVFETEPNYVAESESDSSDDLTPDPLKK